MGSKQRPSFDVTFGNNGSVQTTFGDSASTAAQSHASQLREVRAYIRRRWPKAVVNEYLDRANGARFSRQALDTLMVEVRKGRIDILAVYKLDLLGRSLQHLAQLLGEFETNEISLIVTSQGIDTSESNPAGRLQMHVLAAVAEFERSVIRERINAGLAAARDRGVRLGRPRTLDRHHAAVAKPRRNGMSGRDIAAELGIPAGSVFAIMRGRRNRRLTSVHQKARVRVMRSHVFRPLIQGASDTCYRLRNRISTAHLTTRLTTKGGGGV